MKAILKKNGVQLCYDLLDGLANHIGLPTMV